MGAAETREAALRRWAAAVRAQTVHVVRTFCRVGLGPADLAAGARFCATVAAASGALALAGRPDVALFGVLGAFPVMYGRGAVGRIARAKAEAHALVLVGSGVLGGSLLAAAGAGPWQLVGWEAAFCALACLYAAWARTAPPGPFFALFAFGASSSAHPEGGLAVGLGAFAATAVVAILAGVALPPEKRGPGKRGPQKHDGGRSASSALSPAARPPAVLPPAVRPPAVRPPAVRPPAVRPPAVRPPAHAPGVARHAAAVAAAGLLGLSTGAEHAYWAMASSVTPLAAIGLAGMGVRGIHRVVGSCAGVVVALPLLMVPRPPALLLTAVAVLALPTEAYMRRNYALALTFFTPLILAMTALGDPGGDGHRLVVDRGLQTALGALVGLAVGIAFELAARRRRGRRIHRGRSAGGRTRSGQSVSGPEQ